MGREEEFPEEYQFRHFHYQVYLARKDYVGAEAFLKEIQAEFSAETQYQFDRLEVLKLQNKDDAIRELFCRDPHVQAAVRQGIMAGKKLGAVDASFFSILYTVIDGDYTAARREADDFCKKYDKREPFYWAAASVSVLAAYLDTSHSLTPEETGTLSRRVEEILDWYASQNLPTEGLRQAFASCGKAALNHDSKT